MLSGADAKQLYEDKKNIFTVKKIPFFIYIPFLRKMQDKFTYAFIMGYMKNLGGFILVIKYL